MRKSKLLAISGTICLALLLAALSFMAACAEPAPAPSPTPAPAPSPAPSPAPAPTPAPAPSPTPAPTPAPEPAGVIELNYADWSPPQSGVAVVNQQWADRINENSGGRINITCYFAEALVRQAEVYRAVKSGVADMAYYVASTDTGIHELSRIIEMPLVGVPSMEAGTEIVQKLYDEFPEIRAEWQGVVPMGFRTMAPTQFHFTKRVVRVPDDIKGMKVRAYGPWMDVVNNAGGAAIYVPITEVYMALERGLVESIWTHFPVTYIFKMLDLLEYHTMFGAGGAAIGSADMYMLNQGVWDSLPPDLQEVVEEATEWRVQEIIRADNGEIETAMNYCKDRDHTFTYITPEEIQMWQDVAKPLHDAWITNNAAAGPTQAIYDRAMQLIAEWK